MENLVETFRGKRVLITGHTGFKGSWLATWLLMLGADVIGYGLEPKSGPNHFTLLGLREKITHFVCDIRDADELDTVFAVTQPEIVFHLAAQALVRRSYEDPAGTFDANVRGSVNILEAARKCASVKALVFVTSDKCYENNEWLWSYRENDRLGGRDPYSASKACAELVFSAYQHSFLKFPAASARVGNVIGGGDWSKDRIVPDAVRAFLAKEVLLLRYPSATRPWQHVLEPLSGYLTLAARLLGPEGHKYAGGAWNFGPSTQDCRTVLEVAAGVASHFDGEVGVSGDHGPHEAGLLQLNCEKAYALLGWKPTWDFEKRISETARWYKAWSEGADVWELTTGQIRDFST